MAAPITLSKTVVTEHQLTTPDEIVAYLVDDYAERAAKAPFAPGERVKLVGRAGLPGDMAAGDVAVVIWADTTFCSIMAVHRTAGVMVISIMTDNLAKWDAA
ncbi:hypothetical protein MKK60_19190 [Methylobacterium sp. J-092]|nr:hypothetical protein [Methylobacterium sp. J-092]